MSLIRANSNPEGMYVFGGCGQAMELYSGRGWHLSNIGPDQEDQRGMFVPYEIFYRVCRKADYISDDRAVEIQGFRVEEQHIFVKSGRLVPENRSPGTVLRRGAAETLFAIKLSYKDKYVFLFRVTWEYIRRNAIAQDNIARREARKKLDIVAKIGLIGRSRRKQLKETS